MTRDACDPDEPPLPKDGELIEVVIAVGSGGCNCVVIDAPDQFWEIARDEGGDTYFSDNLPPAAAGFRGVYVFSARFTVDKWFNGEGVSVECYWKLLDYCYVPLPCKEVQS